MMAPARFGFDDVHVCTGSLLGRRQGGVPGCSPGGRICFSAFCELTLYLFARGWFVERERYNRHNSSSIN